MIHTIKIFIWWWSNAMKIKYKKYILTKHTTYVVRRKHLMSTHNLRSCHNLHSHQILATEALTFSTVLGFYSTENTAKKNPWRQTRISISKFLFKPLDKNTLCLCTIIDQLLVYIIITFWQLKYSDPNWFAILLCWNIFQFSPNFMIRFSYTSMVIIFKLLDKNMWNWSEEHQFDKTFQLFVSTSRLNILSQHHQ